MSTIKAGAAGAVALLLAACFYQAMALRRLNAIGRDVVAKRRNEEEWAPLEIRALQLGILRQERLNRLPTATPCCAPTRWV